MTKSDTNSFSDNSQSVSESNSDHLPAHSDDSQSDPQNPIQPIPISIHPISKRPISSIQPNVEKTFKKMMTVVAIPAPESAIYNNNGNSNSNSNNNSNKKLLFQRLWSEENEIELIRGMIDYVKVKGKDPLTDVVDFHGFVKTSLHVDVNDRQVLTKARRLKKKFENNAVRVVESKGKVRSFSNPHEKKMYELSKHLWGGNNNDHNDDDDDENDGGGSGGGGGGGSKKVKVTSKTNKSCKPMGSGDNEVEGRVGLGVTDSFGTMGWMPITDEVIMSKGLGLLSGSKKAEMEEKWRNLKVLELEHFLKKVEVLKEQAEIVLNAVTKSGAK